MTSPTHAEEVRKGFTDTHGVAHIDYEYSRQRVAEVYMICEPKAGKRFIEVKDNHNSQQWAEMIAYVAEELYGNARHITLVEVILPLIAKQRFMRCMRCMHRSGQEPFWNTSPLLIRLNTVPGLMWQKSLRTSSKLNPLNRESVTQLKKNIT